MRKRDVQFHAEGYGGRMLPAVNVKVYDGPTGETWRQLRRDEHIDPRFDQAWIDAHLTDADREAYWQAALEHGWEQLQEDVNEEYVFGRKVAIASEGRSGGWAVVYNPSINGVQQGPLFDREDVLGWDAIALGRWARFARFCRETVRDVPYQYLMLIYLNRFEPWAEVQGRLEQATAGARG